MKQLCSLPSLFCLFVLSVGVSDLSAQTAVTPGTSLSYSTIYSIGIEWKVSGDTNHDAAASVDYRIQGTAAWTAALPLVRVDANGANMLAGSILFLTPATSYDVRVVLTDPDGGAETRNFDVTTQPLPALPTGGRTFHVVPGAGGGDGSTGNPFQGVGSAQAAAQPGDTLLLHVGSYGDRIRFDKAGTASSYLVWKAFGDGEVLMNGIDIAASHVWLEGLTVRNQKYATRSIGAPQNVVVRRCSFYNNHYSIYLQQGGSGWYIADNTIVGDTPSASGSLEGEGIELNVTNGHTVAHNSITNVADGISYPRMNVDIFGNDIFDTSDDGIEADNGRANVRIWGNRIHNAVHNGISFQPQSGAPWYIIRNQIVSNAEGAFKFRTTDRFVLLHNTIVNWGESWPGDAMICCNEGHLLRAIARNNLWISVQGGQIWGFDEALTDWRTDLNADGFDWGAAPNPFSYGGVIYPDVASFTAATGLESRGIRISRTECFETFDVPNPPKAPVPPQTMTLKSTCNAVDAGEVLPNVNAGMFGGSAPDLGAFEYGGTPPTYGPRIEPTIRLTVAPATIPVGGTSTLTWTSTDATSVAIDHAVGAVAPSGSTTVAPTSTTTYTATATGANGVATATATLSVDTPPNAPTELTATVVSDQQIDLHWHDNATDENAFAVEASINGGPFAEIVTLGADSITFSVTGLVASTDYAFRVRAQNAVGWSEYSNVASATTALAPLGAPTTLTATAGTAQIDLRWTDRSSNEAGFSVERSSAGQPFLLLARVARDMETYSDTSAAGGTQYFYRVAAYNDGGGSPYSNTASATIPVSAGVIDEVVLYAAGASPIAGQWQLVTDASAAAGQRLQNPNAGAAKLSTALAAPSSYFELTFNADAGRPYHFWMRGKATSNSWENDSVFIQFDKSVTQSGAPVYRIGTTSAITYTLEDCTSCGVSGWGWQDNGFGAGVLGPALYFAASGPQRIRIQVREDGLGIDQVMLSAVKYLTSSPGALKNDTTILARTGSGDGSPANVPPAARITSPAADATFATPATLSIVADASDSDGWITNVEFLVNGTRVGTRTASPWTFTWSGVGTGSYSLTARATDNLGATTTSAAVPVSVAATSSPAEIVLNARTATVGGGWTVTADSTAAGGARLQNPDLGAARLTTPLASPANYFELTFTAEAGRPYRLWIRGKATANSWANDSVYVQFDNSVTGSGTPIYRIGTTSATTYTLEDCISCGVSGWGWQDNGFGAGVLGPAIYFASSGPQRIRIQAREDGLGIDQVVLSADQYLMSAPGALKNDATILPAP
jgi:hypothetical protein